MDEGKIYDIFFDPSMPYDALTLLSHRRTSPAGGLMILDLHLEQGDIADGFWDGRRDILFYADSLYRLPSIDSATRLYELKDACERIASAREGKDVLRIWRSSCARDMCGMMYIMHLTEGKDLTVIDMPLTPGLRFGDLSGAPDEVVYSAFSGSCVPGENVRRDWAEKWEKLREENSPVRVLSEDGTVSGRDADCFDDEILLKVPEEGSLLSEALHDIKADRRMEEMGEAFYVKRIRSLISRGLFTCLSEEPSDAFPFDMKLMRK